MKEPIKKSNFIYENFLVSLKDLKKIKNYFWFSFFLFFLITFIGFLFPIFYAKEILALIKELIQQTEGLGPLELIRFIMANNIKSSFFAMFLGILLGIFPLAVIVINAYVLGFVANIVIEAQGFLILWRLLPHGIFEIPAILISAALGLRIGIGIMKDCIKDYNKKISNLNLILLMILSLLFFPIAFLIYMVFTFSKKYLRKKFYKNIFLSLRIFVFIVIPLLVIAGIIEGFLITLI